MELRHDEIEELLGAYALDAVDDDERAAVEAHLDVCPRCRAEVDAHREVAAHLARTGAPAPDALWDRIAGAIAGEPPPPLRLVVEAGDRPESAAAAPTVPAARRRRWGRAPLAAAAAVLAVALVGAGFALRGGNGGAGDRAGIAEVALAAFESPHARTTELVDDAGRTHARVAVLPDGTGYLLAGSLPDRAAGVYQLWGSDGETVVSLGVLGRAPDVVPFHADPAQVLLMISEEDAPVAQPSGEPIAVGQLT